MTGDRCPWASSTPDYLAYHDDEWGRPVTDERGLFERMTLEAFQSGLSWLTILRKREAFREAFRDFDAEAVARFGDGDVARLLDDARIVRNRAKVEATIANARALVALHDAGATLAGLVWAARPETDPPAPAGIGDVPPFTDASKALARGAQAARLPLPRPDDGLRRHAGMRGRQRPRRDLRRPRRGTARARGAHGTHWSSAGVSWSSCVIARAPCDAR